MKAIQFILAPFLVLMLILLEKRLKQSVFLKVFMFAIIIIGILLSIWPDLTVSVAHLLGVGRGVDLLFYLTITGLLTTSILLYIRIQNLERKLTALVRNQALKAGEDRQEGNMSEKHDN